VCEKSTLMRVHIYLLLVSVRSNVLDISKFTFINVYVTADGWLGSFVIE
jgi:hypothetical protein